MPFTRIANSGWPWLKTRLLNEAEAASRFKIGAAPKLLSGLRGIWLIALSPISPAGLPSKPEVSPKNSSNYH